MAVDRLSVTVPSELGAALRALAEQRGEPVSALVTEAIAREVRLANLDLAIAEADRRHGQLTPKQLAGAEAKLAAARKKPKSKARRKAA